MKCQQHYNDTNDEDDDDGDENDNGDDVQFPQTIRGKVREQVQG